MAISPRLLLAWVCTEAGRGHKSQRRQARRLGAKEKWQEGWWLGGATRTPSSSSNTSRISVAAGRIANDLLNTLRSWWAG